MPQIYITASLTFLVSLVLWGSLVYSFTRHQRQYFWLLPLGLPLSALGNLLIRPQLLLAVGRAAGIPPGQGLLPPIWFLAFMVLLGPLVEEGIKIAPLLLRPAWRIANGRPSAFWAGFVLGVSFGLGEAAFIAYAIARNGSYDLLPWYAFTGFMGERIMTCFAHGVFTAIVVTGIQRGGVSGLYGYLSAVGLHLFLNTPAALYQFRLIPVEAYSLIMAIPVVVLAIVFERLRRAMEAGLYEPGKNETMYWRRDAEQPR